MPLFRYTVVDKTGKTLNGVMSARDENAVTQGLAAMGYTVQAVVGAGAGLVTPTVAPRAPIDHIPPSLEPMIPMRTLAAYLRQMASLVRSGFTPYQATNEIISRTRNYRLRRALQNMLAQVQAGGHLTPVMAAYPRIFPTKVVGLVYCGEAGGFLDTALDEAATNIEDETSAQLWPRIAFGFLRFCVIWSLITYPATRADVWMNKLMNMTTGKGTSGLVYVKDYYMNEVKHVSLPIIAAFLAATYAWPHIKRIPSVRSALDFVILKSPLWGKLHMSRALSRFGKSLAQLYAAGLPPGPAWNAASSACPNSVVANKLRAVGSALNSGGTLSSALENSRVFDAESVGLLISGEQAGDIPGTLRKLAEYNDAFASARHRAGRWISISMAINAFLILSGVLFLTFWWGYGKILMKLIEDSLGG